MDHTAPSPDEVLIVGRAIATAVAPEDGLTDTQVAVLRAVTRALTASRPETPEPEARSLAQAPTCAVPS